MPKMVTIIPAKAKPDECRPDVWAAIKKQGSARVSAITAREAIKNSGGAWQIKSDAPAASVAVFDNLSLEAMDNDELKLLCARYGKPIRKKQISRAALMSHAQACLDGTEIVDDDGGDDSNGAGEYTLPA